MDDNDTSGTDLPEPFGRAVNRVVERVDATITADLLKRVDILERRTNGHAQTINRHQVELRSWQRLIDKLRETCRNHGYRIGALMDGNARRQSRAMLATFLTGFACGFAVAAAGAFFALFLVSVL